VSEFTCYSLLPAIRGEFPLFLLSDDRRKIPQADVFKDDGLEAVTLREIEEGDLSVAPFIGSPLIGRRNFLLPRTY